MITSMVKELVKGGCDDQGDKNFEMFKQVAIGNYLSSLVLSNIFDTFDPLRSLFKSIIKDMDDDLGNFVSHVLPILFTRVKYNIFTKMRSVIMLEKGSFKFRSPTKESAN